MSQQRFVDRVVLVTGGGGGIGRATAVAFAREGAAVVVAGRSPRPLAETVGLIESGGGRAHAVTADVSEAGDVRHAVDEAVTRYGGLHVAFNNAGALGTPAPVADLDDETWSTLVATNLTGTWLSMKHEIAHMREHGGGAIINTATINLTAVPGLAGYAATKAGVLTLTRAAARDYISAGIRINAVSPGPIDTPMSLRPGETEADRAARNATRVPLGRIGATEEVAAAVLWLASDESSFTVGHELVVDGGISA